MANVLYLRMRREGERSNAPAPLPLRAPPPTCVQHVRNYVECMRVAWRPCTVPRNSEISRHAANNLQARVLGGTTSLAPGPLLRHGVLCRRPLAAARDRGCGA